MSSHVSEKCFQIQVILDGDNNNNNDDNYVPIATTQMSDSYYILIE